MNNLLPLLLKGIKTRKEVAHSHQALNVLQSTMLNASERVDSRHVFNHMRNGIMKTDSTNNVHCVMFQACHIHFEREMLSLIYHSNVMEIVI